MNPDGTIYEKMDIRGDWNSIRKHFSRSFRTSFHVSIASVDPENNPTITPIGSLFLNRNRTGYNFEKFPSKLPLHAKTNPGICVLAVNSSSWLWIRSLWSGKFKTYPGIKLYGSLGERRKATSVEITRLNKRMRLSRGMKGNAYLWGDMEYVRDVSFTRAEIINLGDMTRKLKSQAAQSGKPGGR
jgi:hypothetical protein